MNNERKVIAIDKRLNDTKLTQAAACLDSIPPELQMLETCIAAQCPMGSIDPLRNVMQRAVDTIKQQQAKALKILRSHEQC